MIKAVVFDIGGTLVTYNRPLNWQALYKSALEEIDMTCAYKLNDEDYHNAIAILAKYNTESIQGNMKYLRI